MWLERLIHLKLFFVDFFREQSALHRARSELKLFDYLEVNWAVLKAAAENAAAHSESTERAKLLAYF